MKTLIITIVVLLLNLSGLYSNTNNQKTTIRQFQEGEGVTLEEIRLERYNFLPKKAYSEDSDLDIFGTKLYLNRNLLNKQSKAIENILKYKKYQSQPQQVKYLDFTILSEENIS